MFIFRPLGPFKSLQLFRATCRLGALDRGTYGYLPIVYVGTYVHICVCTFIDTTDIWLHPVTIYFFNLSLSYLAYSDKKKSTAANIKLTFLL